VTPRTRILRSYRAALAELDLERLVAGALARAPRRPHRIIAIGKAAKPMFAGARGLELDGSVVIGPEDAGHPLPDARSVRAAEACLELVQRAGDARIVVLVSGGASALVCAPAPGVTLADKREVTRAMLASGATIQEINVVRKHLSRIKGGGLARAARPREIRTLVVSDVIGGSAADVGSGPSVLDRSTVREARALLRRHAPDHASLPLVPTLAHDRRRLPARVLASPEHLARAIARTLGAKVLRPSQEDVEELAADYIARAVRLRPGEALVRAAEPSVVVPKRAGKGGRSSHLAALVARGLPSGVSFAALATDGVDGASGTAGAIVDARLASHPDLERALAAFDTGPLHLGAGTALPARPSGHNLADLHVLVRVR
jgi:hydroxypyruvate reductase